MNKEDRFALALIAGLVFAMLGIAVSSAFFVLMIIDLPFVIAFAIAMEK